MKSSSVRSWIPIPYPSPATSTPHGIVVHEKVSIGDDSAQIVAVRGTRPRPVGHRNHHRRTGPAKDDITEKDAGRNVWRSELILNQTVSDHVKRMLEEQGHRIQRPQPRTGSGSGLLHGVVQRARHGAGRVVRTRRQSGRLAAGRTLRNGASDAGRGHAAAQGALGTAPRSYTAR